MTPHDPRPVLVLVAGPIASGKSAVSRRLAEDLRATGSEVALVELDAIADMARPNLPDWADAHRIFASVVGQWLGADLDVVIAESVSDRSELETVREHVPAGTTVLTVVLTCSVETALARALSDPTRGISRDERFLRGVHAEWAREMPRIPADLPLDTGTTAIDVSVRRIRAALDDLPET